MTVAHPVPLKLYDSDELETILLTAYPGNRAIQLAVRAASISHMSVRRSVPRIGEVSDPYVIHPLRNAVRVHRWVRQARLGGDTISRDDEIALVVIALLHDTVEDAPQLVAGFLLAHATPGFDPERGAAITGDRYQDIAIRSICHVLGRKAGWGVAGMTNDMHGPIDTDPVVHYVDHAVTACGADWRVLVNKVSDNKDNLASLPYGIRSDRAPRTVRRARKYVALLTSLAPVVPTVPHAVLASIVGSEVRELIDVGERIILADGHGPRRAMPVKQLGG